MHVRRSWSSNVLPAILEQRAKWGSVQLYIILLSMALLASLSGFFMGSSAHNVMASLHMTSRRQLPCEYDALTKVLKSPQQNGQQSHDSTARETPHTLPLAVVCPFSHPRSMQNTALATVRVMTYHTFGSMAELHPLKYDAVPCQYLCTASVVFVLAACSAPCH